ncbi:hypothetical protein [Luteimonas sp. A649]
MDSSLIPKLIRQRRRLFQSYIVHVVWFAAMIITAIAHSSKTVIAASILLALVTVPPVIAYAAAVHRTCRAIDPTAKTIGLIPMIIMTVLFTPFESGLVVPAKNLLVSGRLVRQHQSASAGPGASTQSDPSLRPDCSKLL